MTRLVHLGAVPAALAAIAAVSLSPWISLAAFLTFATVAGFVTWRVNAAHTVVPSSNANSASTATPPDAVAIDRAVTTAGLFETVFLWGAASLFLGYGMTNLHWQHWWQYGIAMLLLASFATISKVMAGRAAGDPKLLNLLTAITALQGVAAAGGLVFLLISGKLWTDKADWLANHVFLAGGLAVVAMSAAAVMGQRTTR